MAWLLSPHVQKIVLRYAIIRDYQYGGLGDVVAAGVQLGCRRLVHQAALGEDELEEGLKRVQRLQDHWAG